MATKQSKFKPPPSADYAAVPIGDKLYRWDGKASPLRSTKGPVKKMNVVDVFTVKKEQWEYLTTHGPPPPGTMNYACTVIGSSLFTFGGKDGTHILYFDGDRFDGDRFDGDRFDGRTGESCHNSLHQLDTKTMEWGELVPRNPSDAPQKKRSCGMVSLDDDKLVVFAGYTEHEKYTDELHIFDTKKMTWTLQPTTGTKPPPLSHFTFTKIDATRAVVFGGYDGKNRHNDVYILDMRNWEWALLDVSGDPKPSVRMFHAACCLAGPLTGQKHPLLVVVGGFGAGVTFLNDVWLLDIDGRRWKQVALPEAILPRRRHIATVFGSGPDCRQLVLWGGEQQLFGGPIGKTTLLDFDLTRGEWKVTSVVKEDQLGKPEERLRKKMERLWPQTPTRAAASQEERLRREGGAKEAKEREERLMRAEQQLMRAEQQARAAKEREESMRAEGQVQAAKQRKESMRREREQAKEVRELKEQLRRAKQQAEEAKERKENMRRVEALEQVVELLKKTNAPPHLVPPDSTVPQRGDKPKFHHLKLFKGKDGNTIRVIETVASKWDDLAYSLHFERHVVKTIQRDNPQDSESACGEVLDRWLSGDLTTRQPVTWATLIQSLRDCQQNSLAEDLERALL